MGEGTRDVRRETMRHWRSRIALSFCPCNYVPEMPSARQGAKLYFRIYRTKIEKPAEMSFKPVSSFENL